MTLFLLALNLALVVLIVVFANLFAGRHRTPGSAHRGRRTAAEADLSVVGLLSSALSNDEQVTVTAASVIARNPETYETALVSTIALARTAVPRARLALLWAIHAILRRRPEWSSLCAEDPSPEVRAAVVRALATVATSEAPTAGGFSSLIEAAAGDLDPYVRRAAYGGLHLISADRAITLIWRGLDDGDDEVRRLACAALARRIDVATIDRVVDRLSTANHAETRRILQALAQSDSTVVEPLIRVAGGSSPPRVRVGSLRALAAVGVPATCVDLVPMLSDASPAIRRATASAVAEIARLAGGRGIHGDVVRGLAAQLRRESDTHVILALVDALETCAGEEGVAALLEKLPSLSAAIRERALEALAVLQRRPGPAAHAPHRLVVQAS